MDCSEVDELAGAIALGALPPEEARRVEEHLSSCQRDHGSLLELRQVAALLPFAVDAIEPPPRLKQNLIAAALNDGAAAGAAPSADGQPRLRIVPHVDERQAPASAPAPPVPARATPARPSRFWRQPGVWAAAAALLIAVGLGAWNVSLQRRLNDRDAANHRQAQALTVLAAAAHVTPLSGSGGLQLAFAAAPDGTGHLVLTHVPAAPAGKIYQAWFIREGKPVSAGVFNGDGVSVVPLQGSSAGAQIVAVTLEPAGGSLQPSGQPIEAATLGS
ncbi:MAG TPA: anti-sigma factor [Dehalococcoidia bacterium]|nr:anti-sigma factor [Dehalococcoidia bacterium]